MGIFGITNVDFSPVSYPDIIHCVKATKKSYLKIFSYLYSIDVIKAAQMSPSWTHSRNPYIDIIYNQFKWKYYFFKIQGTRLGVIVAHNISLD